MSSGAQETEKAWFEKCPLDYDKGVTDGFRESHLFPGRWKPGENRQASLTD